ncbi:MAG: 3'(2'),5'-bisphosphate nucleotidase CysQ [Vicinamibacteria bacterium]|nr:3'(2'),5'-bisphosphate nucleotidase CysQ [Vicinamibacteria bacterium]
MIETRRISVLRDEALAIAVRAGHAILGVRPGSAGVETKEDGSPVTRADRAAHDVIAAGLDEIEPRFPVVSEEGDLTLFRESPPATYWLVDPLDGTKEFLKGLGEYTVNIALVIDGDPTLGVVFAPALDRLFDAALGLGARKTDKGVVTTVAARRLERAKTAVVSRSHMTEETERFLSRLGVREVVHRGSSLKLCAVAEGAADLYPRFGPTQLWDTAAGAVVARETGCHVVDLDGRPLRYDLGAGLAHNGFFVCASDGVLRACLTARSRLSE